MNKRYIKEKLVLKKKVKIILSKFLISIIIFLIALISIKKDKSLKDIINENVFEKSFKFTKMQNVYDKFFTKYLNIERNDKKVESVFTENLNYLKQEKYQNGVKLKVENNYLVPVVESGIIIYIGTKDNLENTIVLEQVDGIETYYSNINISNYKLYDYIEKGEILGEAINNNVILKFKKNGEYLDYKNYI